MTGVDGAAQAGRWPDFIGIGTIKSGTTWLWSCLREHPQLFMPQMKELEFFSERYALGPDWYRRFFATAGSRRCGEISPQYFHSAEAAARMRVLARDTRLLVAFRNPVDRAYSHFQMDARAASGQSPADKQAAFARLACEGTSKYIRFGDYAAQLQPFLEHFGATNLHVVLHDDIVDHPERVIAGVFEFLGVDPTLRPAALDTRVNAAKRYRSVGLFNALRLTVRAAERLWLGPLILYLKRTAIRDRVLDLLEAEEDYPPLDAEVRSLLITRYRESNARLEALIGRDLSAWSRA